MNLPDLDPYFAPPAFTSSPRPAISSLSELSENALDRLSSCLTGRDGFLVATLSELSFHSTVPVSTLRHLLAVDRPGGWICTERLADEEFLLVNPELPIPEPLPYATTLWTRLRDRLDAEAACTYWKVLRGLEDGRWVVETDPRILCDDLDALGSNAPIFGVYAANMLFQGVLHPHPEHFASDYGLLSVLVTAGAQLVVTVPRPGTETDLTRNLIDWQSRNASSGVNILVLAGRTGDLYAQISPPSPVHSFPQPSANPGARRS